MEETRTDVVSIFHGEQTDQDWNLKCIGSENILGRDETQRTFNSKHPSFLSFQYVPIVMIEISDIKIPIRICDIAA